VLLYDPILLLKIFKSAVRVVEKLPHQHQFLTWIKEEEGDANRL